MKHFLVISLAVMFFAIGITVEAQTVRKRRADGLTLQVVATPSLTPTASPTAT